MAKEKTKTRKTEGVKKAKPSKPEIGLRPARQVDEAVTALSLARGPLSPEMEAYLAKCDEKLGFVPNVLAAYAHDNARAFSSYSGSYPAALK